jgi:hypothetical protein
MSRPRIALLVITVALAAVASIQARRVGPAVSAAPSPPAPTVVPIDRAAAATRSTLAAKPRHHVAQSQRATAYDEAPSVVFDRAATRIARNAETGQITAPEYSGDVLTIEQVQAAVRKEAEGLITIHNADGSETINHEGRFADYTMVRIGPDGRPLYVCAHGRVSVERLLRPGAPVRPVTEDR